MKCQPDGEIVTTIFNITNGTKYPGSVGSGMACWNPLKLYAAGMVIERFNNVGKIMNVYWNGLEIKAD